MPFLESRPLDRVAFGAQGGPSFSTDIVAVRSGQESRNRNWSQARHRYEVGLVTRPLSQFQAIRDAFMVVGGRADGFRWKDWADYTVSLAEGDPQPLHGTLQVGTAGAGYGVPSYQLRKLYTSGAGSFLRDIRKPVAGTLTLRRGGTPVTAGGLAGQYSIDNTTGVVTIQPDTVRSISSHTVGAQHVFTFGTAFSPNFVVGGRVYVTNVSGTAASVLNNLSHEIVSVSGAVVTVATSTTGLTAGSGNGYYYPQPTEALDFSCEFDVPVRFDIDQFDAVIVDRTAAELLLQLPSIPLVELRGE
jgi:uncharacterized protein (TIGR02217 family)